MADELLTPDEIAERLRVKRRTVIEWLRVGQLHGVKVGKLWRVSKADLADFLKRGRESKTSDSLPEVAL